MIVDVVVTDLFRLSFGDQASPAVAGALDARRLQPGGVSQQARRSRREWKDYGQLQSARPPWTSSSLPFTQTLKHLANPCSLVSAPTSW